MAGHASAPAWMRAVTSAPIPPHDEKTEAVLMYSEDDLNVVSADKFRTTIRMVYKILRPEGRKFGKIEIPFNSTSEKIVSLRAWCIPAQGDDYEVTNRDSLQVAPRDGGDMTTDLQYKMLMIPAADPGNIIGYEYVDESRPFVLQDVWEFQDVVPVATSSYSLSVPSGWEFKNAFVNHADIHPQESGDGQITWTVNNLKEIREEEDMPAFRGLAGQMVVTLFPPGGATRSLPTWHDLGEWYIGLTKDRITPSDDIKQEVIALTSSQPTMVAKMRALAVFIQQNIRYSAVELGIGGYQPHPASEVFAHRFGDCKDKATLMRSMLAEIGVESYYVIINHERGSVKSDTPAFFGSFDHAIIAVRLPGGLNDSSLVATIQHPTLGKLLFFDPTNTKTSFGEIGSYLQDNYGMLVAPSGGELVELPQQPPTSNGIERTAKMTLTSAGILSGTIHEERVGDRALDSRFEFSGAQKASDRVKPLEALLSDSLSSYQIRSASISNPDQTDQPFIWDYTIQADNYAKFAGDMLLVRPRVLGHKEKGILETPEPRRYDIEFDDGPVLDTDTFEITLPPGYVVDDIPSPVDVDYDFASYHSKTELVGNVLRYHRTFEEKELSVPVSKADQLKKFYRIIASDERNTAILKLAAH